MPVVRNAYIEGKLNAEWKNISLQIDESFEEFSKDYIVIFD